MSRAESERRFTTPHQGSPEKELFLRKLRLLPRSISSQPIGTNQKMSRLSLNTTRNNSRFLQRHQHPQSQPPLQTGCGTRESSLLSGPPSYPIVSGSSSPRPPSPDKECGGVSFPNAGLRFVSSGDNVAKAVCVAPTLGLSERGCMRLSRGEGGAGQVLPLALFLHLVTCEVRLVHVLKKGLF